MLIPIALRVPRADLLEGLRKRLREVSRARPYLIENTERMAKLVKFVCMASEGIRVCGGRGGVVTACTWGHTRHELLEMVPKFCSLYLQFLWSKLLAVHAGYRVHLP